MVPSSPTTHLKGRHRPKLRERGVALFLVLSILVVLSTLVIAFLSSTRSDLVANMHYGTGQEVQALGDTAVHLVMSQIREATLSGLTQSGQGTHIWASQPGAIRVWNDDGEMVQLYKLYSAGLMKEEPDDAGALSFISTEINPDWRDLPELYTDLNEPVSRINDKATHWHYPIIDPSAVGIIQGFSTTVSDDASVPWDATTSMPVRWLYVNQAGEISNELKDDSVGRIAFWTDDESAKVNINTASATQLNHRYPGINAPANDSYWDLPLFQMGQDYNFGRYPLREDEFQRYPGHPATVDLTAVIPTSNTFTLQNILDLTPRYRWGGSQNASIGFGLAEDQLPNRLSGSFRKQNRLYASVDELIFGTTYQPREDNTIERSANLLPGTQAKASPADLERWRFFLTAHSRSPDLNLFGQPRIALWPITMEEPGGRPRQTTYDRLLAFCSTVGGGARKYLYHFQRRNALSQTEDWDAIPRNQTLLATYLYNLTTRKLPGFGGRSFEDKYDDIDNGEAGEWKQILTAMFDWIRCVNLNETASIPADFQAYTPLIKYNSPEVDLRYTNTPGAGVVLPIKIGDWNTRGAGRVPILSEAGFRIIGGPKPTPPQGGGPTPNFRASIALIAETFSPMAGPMPWQPKAFQLKLRNEETGFLVEDQTIFPDGASNPASTNLANLLLSSQAFGGMEGFSWIWCADNTNLNLTKSLSGYPFASRGATNLSIPPGKTSIEIQGGEIALTFTLDGIDYQRVDLFFPATTTRIPEENALGLDWQRNRNNNRSFLIGNDEAIKTLSLIDGDYRVIAYLERVPQNFFVPSPGYDTRDDYAHGLMSHNLVQHEAQIGGYVAGAAYPSTKKPKIRADITDVQTTSGRPEELRAAVWEGDFDNGFGLMQDGAYLGKSDEGWFDRGKNTPNYFDLTQWSIENGFFSPTKQVVSAISFGSLPTSVKRNEAAYRAGNYSRARPWRTLLFCPNPSSGRTHFGFTAPADHLLLDFFHMPIVEPYAISEPLSTAGRINMNTQILPFTNIVRETPIHAVLKGQRVTAVNTNQANRYKTSPDEANIYRFRLNVEETLWQFRSRFAPGGDPTKGDLFRSASEITCIFLVPNTSTTATGMSTTPAIGAAGAVWDKTNLRVDAMTNWWESYRITGNNARERPYNLIYPLLTTRSNTFTVHYRAQTLVRGRAQVTGEYRGSSTIERYIDPEDPRVTGGELNPDTQSLEPLYRFRVIDTKRFAP